MEHDKIILDLLNRVCELENRVNSLEHEIASINNKGSVKVSTNDVRNYIANLKEQAKSRGEQSILLVSNDIHGSMQLKNRMPIVCNAMKQSMSEGDEIIHQTASGYSSTLTIKYYL